MSSETEFFDANEVIENSDHHEDVFLIKVHNDIILMHENVGGSELASMIRHWEMYPDFPIERRNHLQNPLGSDTFEITDYGFLFSICGVLELGGSYTSALETLGYTSKEKNLLKFVQDKTTAKYYFLINY